MKRKPYRNQKILDAAEGAPCMINSPQCNYNPATTVACHLNEQYAGKGMRQKADDCAVAFGCSTCHDWLDGRLQIPDADKDKDWYWLRGIYRTIRYLLDTGVLK